MTTACRGILLYSSLLLSSVSYAQNMQGVVTDGVTGRPMLAVTVVNERTQQATTTDENGFYTIAATQGDKIAFTYVGYKTIEKQKPVSVIIATQNISMEPGATTLREFVFKGDKRTKYQIDSAERMEVYHSPLSRKPPSPFNSPVSAIAELFNKKARMAYAFQKAYVGDEQNRFIDTRYTTKVVVQLTHLTGDSVASFMNTNPMPYDFARNASDLELKMWIRERYKEWIKNPVMIADTVVTQH